MWSKGNTFEDVVVIGEEGGGLYKLKVHLEKSIVYETTRSSEPWHRILSHINYKEFPYVRKLAIGLPILISNMREPARDVHRERTSRIHF